MQNNKGVHNISKYLESKLLLDIYLILLKSLVKLVWLWWFWLVFKI